MASAMSPGPAEARLASLSAVCSGLSLPKRLKLVEAAIGASKDLKVLSQVYDACVGGLQAGA